MTKPPAPSACRYFGTKRIHSSSPAPITKMATSKTTRLRRRPKKSANFRARLTFCGSGVCIRISECDRAVQITRSGDFQTSEVIWRSPFLGGGALRRANRRTRWSSFLHLRLIDLAFAFGVKRVVIDECALENFVIGQA